MEKMKTFLKVVMVTILTIGLFSCEDKEDPIPVVNFKAATYEVSETATSALIVKVSLDMPAPVALSIPFTLGGTAVEGVHYATIANKTIEFAAGAMEGDILITPLNVSTIEGNQTIELKLTSGSMFTLADQNTTTVITLTDNATPPSDAPTVSFVTSVLTKNAYLQEEVAVEVGLSKAAAMDLLIPVTLSGSALAGTNYEATGLTENNEITIPAGEVAASFTVNVKFTNELDLEKDVVVDFATPVVTDYAVDAAANQFTLNIIDPSFDNIWFIEREIYSDRNGNEAVVIAVDEEGNRKYNYDAENDRWTPAPSIINKGYFMPYSQYEKEPEVWSTGKSQYVRQSDDDANMWTADMEYSYCMKHPGDATKYPYYATLASELYSVSKLFESTTYLAGFSSAYSKTATYMRFVAEEIGATSGKVIIPEHTVRFYTEAEEGKWKSKEVAGEYGEQYYYKIVSIPALGVIANATDLKPVDITVSGEGTWDAASKMILFTVNTTSDDSKLIKESITIRMFPLSTDKP